MKRNTWKHCALLGAAAAVLAACGDDALPVGPSEPAPHPLVGTWQSRETTIVSRGEAVVTISTLWLHEDLTAALQTTSADTTGSFPPGSLVNEATGRWRIQNDALLLLWEWIDGEDTTVFRALTAYDWGTVLVLRGDLETILYRIASP